MKRNIWIAIGIIVIVALVIVLTVTQTKKEQGEIKIGAILPLTGEMSSHGQDAKEGIELAVEIKNKAGGIKGKKIVVIYEDDRMQPQVGVSVFEKLTTTDQVQVVLGGIGSSVALAIAPIAERKKVVFISPTASNPKLTYAGDYIFRNWPSDNFEGGTMVKAVYNKLKLEMIAILYVNNDFGQGLKNIFREKFEEAGGTILIEEKYDHGDNDFRTQLLKIKRRKPEAVYLPGYYQEIAKILRQAKEMQINALFLSTSPIENPKLLELAGNAAEGVIYTRPSFDPEHPNEEYKKFSSAFKQKYGKEPGIAAAQCYDVANIIFLSIEQGGLRGEKIQKAMAAVKNFPGVTGTTSFDEYGDVVKEITLFTIRNDKFVPF